MEKETKMQKQGAALYTTSAVWVGKVWGAHSSNVALVLFVQSLSLSDEFDLIKKLITFHVYRNVKLSLNYFLIWTQSPKIAICHFLKSCCLPTTQELQLRLLEGRPLGCKIIIFISSYWLYYIFTVIVGDIIITRRPATRLQDNFDVNHNHSIDMI